MQHVGNEAKETADVGAQHTVRNKPLREDGKGCDGYSCLTTGVHLVLTQTQAAGYTCEKLFWIELFEVERSHLSLDRWRSEVHTLWFQPAEKDMEEGRLFSPAFPRCHWQGHSSVAEPLSPIQDLPLRTSNITESKVRPQGLETIRFWAFLSGDARPQPLNQYDKSHFNIYGFIILGLFL